MEKNQVDFHPACSRKIFGSFQIPLLPYSEKHMLELAKKVIRSQIAVTGVQPKLSIDIEKNANTNNQAITTQRFTIVGLGGRYILKPPVKHYPQLPELEDLTMHLASKAGIVTVPHSLIRLKSNNLAYITKRIDRNKGNKLHMEDMCQLTERLTEDKYKGSYEQIGKVIVKYSVNPGLDLINFFEQVIFSFLTGNADMHLKNFSLIMQPDIGYVLAPAYEMVPSALVVKNDPEELALNLNGKKRKIRRKDFDSALNGFALLEKKAIENIYEKFAAVIPQWIDFISYGFITQKLKEQYRDLIKQRADRLHLT